MHWHQVYSAGQRLSHSPGASSCLDFARQHSLSLICGAWPTQPASLLRQHSATEANVIHCPTPLPTWPRPQTELMHPEVRPQTP